MFRWFYTALLYCLQPVVLGYLFYRGRKNPAYRARISERYGFYGKRTPPRADGILLHAVSVGETLAAVPLIKALLTQYPHLPITVTSVTPTGSARVKALFGERVAHYYLPYDLPDAMVRLFNFIQPQLCLVMETEIWANFIHQAHRRHIPCMIVNARLSARSAKRYGYFKTALYSVWQEMTLIAAQDEQSAVRYRALGVPDEKVKTVGNLKYDFQLESAVEEKIHAWRHAWALGERKIWIAGSTHQGEDALLLQAHRTLLAKYPDLMLIIVPRHPERFEQVAELIARTQLAFVRLSQHVNPTADTQVILGDTMGELMPLYGVSDIAFVAGSLMPVGGHNPLEPLTFKLPVLSGEYVFNFTDVYAKLTALNGVLMVKSDVDAIVQGVEKCLSEPHFAQTLGENGYQVLAQNRGALARVLAEISPFLEKD
ncbi:lipid IV(A) 3-deoxy-D-manno-octulosonic acid transferase [Spirabiliibacterium falconis]|uniref:lipid IV(A) 3-deoxy-D-manno-octulosonic acid transferase n=1 Tax=Spirabiliibacterium falconis TaxID=572023 RepID=UPI001AACC34C|nr:lipid IV(A) 3-deoxy-D-manno-octulosonic acid transferase [Spirabiliibacterium falconis]MBE2894371.1 3-deoxy-D-manno-octulosonic acid transferase [Spirabiliibacterium falconis]